MRSVAKYQSMAEIDRRDHYSALIDDGDTGGRELGLVGWGFVTIVAVVLGFASWQYAPPRQMETETARADLPPTGPGEVTGSIVVSDRGVASVTPSRVVGGSRVAPMPLAANEQVATSRDIDQLRNEIKDLQRRITQMGLSGDGVSRRLDKLEEKVAGDLEKGRERLAALSAPPPPSEPAQKFEAPQQRAEAAVVAPSAEAERPAVAERPPERIAERVPLPTPRPIADLPILTGTVPPKAAETVPAAPPAPVAAPTVAPPTNADVTAAKPQRATRVVTPPPPPPPPAIDPTGEMPPQASAPVAPPPAQVAAAPVVPATTPSGEPAPAIDLGGYRTVGSLKRSWADMADRYAEFGGEIEPLARLRETENGMEARLVAGPYSTQGDAAKACLRLRALGVNCSVTGYTGQPLGVLR